MDTKQKKTYESPNVGAFTIVAAVPALAAPLAFVSAQSVGAFVGGLAGGAALAAWAFGGKVVDKSRSEALLPTE